jgi:16S rRNA (uracil1498-N3)-methyltransferase
MTRRRWSADEVSGNRAILIGNHAQHLARVLRARVGQEFDIATGLAVRKSRITSIAESRVEFELGEEVPAATAAKITLALAVFKFDRMEWAIEKCTELGVAQIVPVIAQRTDVHLAAATIKRTERWRRIARQAAEQSRRAVPPEIAAPVELPEALGLPGDVRIVLAESEEKALLRDVLESLPQEVEIVLAVGPEGGWTVDELQSFHQAGWTSASLGRTVLRAETAAIAATAIATSGLS